MIRVMITVSEEDYAKLKRMKDLEKDQKSASLSRTVIKAVDHWLDRKDPVRRKPRLGAKTVGSGTEPKPQSTQSRYVRKPIETEVWRRDQSRCTFVSQDGRRCCETRGLQLDHIIPFALGGRSDSTENLRLRCPPHNRHAAEEVFGKMFMARFSGP